MATHDASINLFFFSINVLVNGPPPLRSRPRGERQLAMDQKPKHHRSFAAHSAIKGHACVLQGGAVAHSHTGG